MTNNTASAKYILILIIRRIIFMAVFLYRHKRLWHVYTTFNLVAEKSYTAQLCKILLSSMYVLLNYGHSDTEL